MTNAFVLSTGVQPDGIYRKPNCRKSMDGDRKNKIACSCS